MKKYKQVLAALLAMNLTVYVMPTGVVKISAGVESQSNEDTTENTTETEAVGTSEEPNSIDPAAGDVSTNEDSVSEAEISDETEAETPSSDSTEAEVTDENIDDTAETPEEVSDETDSAPAGEEELFSDGTQTEAVADGQTGDTAVQADNTGTLDLEQLAGYNEDTKTMTVDSNQDLILLSNCNPQQVAGITINFTSVGEVDVTEKNKIPAGTDISEYFKTAESVASSDEVPSASDISETEGAQPAENTEVQESGIQSQGDTAEVQSIIEENAGTDVQAEESVDSTGTDTQDIVLQSVTAERDYSYQGIGNEQYPFKGTIGGIIPETFKIDHSLFCGLSSSAKYTAGNNKITWCGKGDMPMIAEAYQFDSKTESGHTLPVVIQGDASAVMGSLIGTVRASDDQFKDQILKIESNTVTYGATVSVNSASGNAALVCETLEDGTICLDGYTFPTSKYTVQSTASYSSDDASAAGNAGGVIGVMKTGTTLDIKSAVTSGATVSSANGNAGGMVGLMQQGAKITVSENAAVTFNNSAITGNTTAGGVVGMTEDVTFADSDIAGKITVTSPAVTATGTETNAPAAGGFIGKYTLNAENLGDAANDLKLPNQLELISPTLTVSNSGLAGGYFGHLDLNGKLIYTIGGTDSNTKKEVKPTYTNCTARDLGAIVGKVTSNTIESTLLIQNMKISATKGRDSGINYYGGLVGELGNYNDSSKAVYLKVSDSDISVVSPQVTDNGTNAFGGIAGLLAQGSILRTEGAVKIVTQNGVNKGGGLVGYVEKSVISLSGTTDLSGVSYAGGTGKSNKPKTGWLAGWQDCALIYANGDGNGNGWTYIRGKENTTDKQAMNDIGNYGQIIRLKSGSDTDKSQLSSNLITISDENHAIQYTPKTSVALNGDEITIGSEDAFALLSIAWNSRGYFGGVAGIAADNTPKSKNITLSENIDLTGSGIAGLSRDAYSTDDTYSGTFDGNNKTITLAIGETFGFKQDAVTTLASEGDDGYGEVVSAGAYYHGRQGLFAMATNATVKNLTINGKINVSSSNEDILVGGIAGELAGRDSNSKVSGVTAEEIITADCEAGNGLMIGGFFGGSYDNNAALELGTFGDENTRNTAAATINIKNRADKNTNYDIRFNAGGVIGEIGESKFTFTANCLTVGGSITTSVSKRAYVGGLIGVIKGNNQTINHQIKIKDVIFNTFKINAENATEMCGGLLGSIWADVELYFMGKDDTDNGTNTKLNVKNAEINAPNAVSVGGLSYRSSGKWEIRDNGIDLEKLTIKAGTDIGLLVCRGEKANDQMGKVDETREVGALYLCTTKYWDTSYKIAKDNVSINTTKAGVFDEFVAYTTSSAKEIVDNDKNGIISIATADDGKGGRVGVDVSGYTTYQNRTAYGKNHPTNACSRYYYDLDQCQTDLTSGVQKSSNNNGKLDTPQELLLWSVYNYASENIRKYFELPDVKTKSDNDNTPWVIGEGSTELDMQKYSYYPIKYDGGSVNVSAATIKFWNKEIEDTENGAPDNKSTQGVTNGVHTQHYTMHCGLFLTYTSPRATLTVDSVKFEGTIGKINNSSSGVLIADTASGYVGSDGVIRTVTVRVNNTTFNNLKVNECGDGYAPLLINSIGSYVTLDINKITTRIDGKSTYTEGTAVASSLIGTVGSGTARQINMTFQNIILPDKKADGTEGIFSHATLLESFAYDKEDNASGATYNFYSTEDWNGTEHKHEVTYGKEITGTTEFENLQKWYYDESTYTTDDGLVYDNVENRKNFDASGYLSYVCVPYNKDNCTHEIKVNQRVVDITNGCGTYGHPYRITKESEMKILSDYMASGEPRKDWRVTITGSQDTAHSAKSATDYTSDQDVTYQYDGNGYWVQVENKGTSAKTDWQPVSGNISLSKEFMRYYLLNAYYDIEGTVVQGNETAGPELVLNNFKGFGTEDKPFRGVVTSKNNTTVVLQGADTGNGFIPYSYGSVVKNLKISYRVSDDGARKTLTYGNDTAYYPKVCFGGVIGCVLGGDNVIDDVTVAMDENWLTLAGNKKHLIQVGGYIGSVSGGGVIFRNMENKPGLTDEAISNQNTDISVGEKAYYSLYVNPYVGRVLDGFAFNESASKTDELKNTDKNYKINTLVTKDTNCVNAGDNTITVNDAQGLLILSAVVNSGAASNGISNAYGTMGRSEGQVLSFTTSDNKTTYSFGGQYGKVRNASYGEIGTTGADAASSGSEDKNLPGDENLPYLISKYCNNKKEIFSSARNSDLEIDLSADNTTGFDMTDYGNGYQGISARYVSNAVRGYADGYTLNHPEGVIPELTKFNGNDNIVTVDMQVREYADDDFHAASVGGMFNILRVSQNGTVSNLTIGAETQSSTLSLNYYDNTGKSTEVSKTTWPSSEDVGIGGLAGSLVGYTDDNANRDITISKIQLNRLTIESPASAGGIVGNTGKPTVNTGSKVNTADMSAMLQPQKSQVAYGIAFNDCSYKSLTVTGKYAAGGFAGYIGNTDQNPKSTVNENGVSGALTRANMGESSTISALDKSSWAGGLFGYVKTRLFINMTQDGSKQETYASLQDVSVSAGIAVGGCVGYIAEKRYGIHNVTVKGTNSSKVNISLNSDTTGTFYVGGIVGYAKGGWNDWHPDNWDYVGYVGGSSIENVQINTLQMAGKNDYSNTGEIKTNYITGGIVGQTAGGKTRMENCTVTTSDIYGSVASGITGQTDSQMEFTGCEINGTSEDLPTNIKGFSTAGGILGFWTGGQKVTIQGCKIQYLKAEGKDWGSGAIIGDAKGGGAGILYLFDTSAQDSTVTASGNENDGGGRWPCVGSIIGNLRNSIKASNVLISGVTLTASRGKLSNETHGLLFGSFSNNIINIAGISIQNIPESNSKWSLAGGGSINADKSYIAFADYSGTSTDTSDTSQAGSSKDLVGTSYSDNDKVKTDVEPPYTVTSPKSTLALYENATASPKYLFGDGASWTSADGKGVMAKTIWDNKNQVTEGHYAYNSTGVKEFNFDSAISSYSANQTIQSETGDTDQVASKVVADFPVIQIGSGSADVVQDYLNILTNGAFSVANNINKNGDVHVTANVDVYQEDADGKFIKVNSTPAFNASADSAGKITFSTTTDYDNGRNRFNLLTVTFKEKDADGKEHTYNVFVPVLVRRMLEVDFSATLSYGTNFRKANYEDLQSHVLESFGSSITAYLTYTYNSEEGTYTDYGWQSYIDAGGNVAKPMDRELNFVQGDVNFPTGTQLSLVDCRTGKVYYYTVNEPVRSIKLTAFKDSDGKSYEAPSIAELMNAKATQSNIGTFIKVDQNGKPEGAEDEKDYPAPTVRLWNSDSKKYEYYRRAESGERGAYTITVDQNKLKNTVDGREKSTVSENYYLVLTVPKTSDSDALNGSLQTSITNEEIPHQIHYMNIQGKTDSHNNTASTYLISKGYQQDFKEDEKITTLYKKMSTADTTMQIDVVDKITFPKGQAYLDEDSAAVKDELYLRFVGSLQKTISESTSAEQFPSGTTGTVNFYVYKMDGETKNYYKYNSTTKKWDDVKQTETVGASYTWISEGGNMELPLADGSIDNIISLQDVRRQVKNGDTTGNGVFYVEARMEASIPAAGLNVIPESKEKDGGAPVDYTKLVYSSQISTEKTNLSYSTNRRTFTNTKTAYYREEPEGAKLTYEADQIGQLGINLLDLQYLDATEQHSLIETTATYDLSTLKDLDNTLKNSTGIRFTLSLSPKNTASGSNLEDYQNATANARDYLSVEVKTSGITDFNYNSGRWTWTVPKSMYWDNDKIKTSDMFNGAILTQAIRLKVNVDNIQDQKHFYSNYKVGLTAEILQNNNQTVGSASDNIIYTLAKIKPEFQ